VKVYFLLVMDKAFKIIFSISSIEDELKAGLLFTITVGVSIA